MRKPQVIHKIKDLLKLLMILAPMAIPMSVNAGFIYDLRVAGPGEGFIGQGQIEFSTLLGNSTSGVDAFSFTASSPKYPDTFDTVTFGKDDIAVIDWSINSSGDLILHRLLSSLVEGIYPASNTVTSYAIYLASSIGLDTTLPSLCGENANVTSGYCNTNGYHQGGRLLEIKTPSEQWPSTNSGTVPEPSALGLLSLGLLSLAVTRCRQAWPCNN